MLAREQEPVGRMECLARCALSSLVGLLLAVAPAGAAENYDYGTNAAVAWGQGIDGRGGTVAVIDTGLLDHNWTRGRTVSGLCFSPAIPDLLGSVCADGTNLMIGEGAGFVRLPGSVSGRSLYVWNHGTQVAGAAVGASKTWRAFPTGARGIAPGAWVLPAGVASLDLSSQEPRATTDGVAAAVSQVAAEHASHMHNTVAIVIPAEHAIANSEGARFRGHCDHEVIGTPLERLAEQINGAINDGISVVVPAGNHGQDPESRDTLGFPACLSGVITVGALERDTLKAAPFSPVAQGVDVMAPGTGITTPVALLPKGSSTVDPESRGTSYSAPIVAGAIALLKQQQPELTPAQVKARLTGTGPLVRLDGADNPTVSIKRHALRIDKLLGIADPKIPGWPLDRGCFELGLTQLDPKQPGKRFGYVRLRCAPSKRRPDRLVVTVDGRGVAAVSPAQRTVPLEKQSHYAAHLFTVGVEVDVQPGEEYRVCALYYRTASRDADNDRLGAATVCEDFMVPQ